MVVKKSSAGKQKASRSVKARVVLSRKKVIGDEGGVSLDDAFGDDEDVEHIYEILVCLISRSPLHLPRVSIYLYDLIYRRISYDSGCIPQFVLLRQ